MSSGEVWCPFDMSVNISSGVCTRPVVLVFDVSLMEVFNCYLRATGCCACIGQPWWELRRWILQIWELWIALARHFQCRIFLFLFHIQATISIFDMGFDPLYIVNKLSGNWMDSDGDGETLCQFSVLQHIWHFPSFRFETRRVYHSRGSSDMFCFSKPEIRRI